MNASGIDPLWWIRLGVTPYSEALELQERVADARRAGEVPDTLILLEHSPVYTRGRRSTEEELPMGAQWYGMQGIEVLDTDRGGRVTYHGPGQIVAYPIVDLAAYENDVHAYVRRLEEVMIGSLAAWEIEAQVIDGLTGVWTAGAPPVPSGSTGPQGTIVGEAIPSRDGSAAAKIGSIGVHVNKGVTTHGLAVNVDNDLQPFDWIIPCGIEHCQATSVSRELGGRVSPDEFAATLLERFSEIYRREPVAIDESALPVVLKG